MSLLDDIPAAIFVAPAEQGAGIGSACSKARQRLREQLSLTVYAANNASIAFLSSSRLPCRRRATDAHTGHPERLMTAASGVGRRRRRLAVVVMALQCDLPDRQPNLRR